jgi:hypothetical protein
MSIRADATVCSRSPSIIGATTLPPSAAQRYSAVSSLQQLGPDFLLREDRGRATYHRLSPRRGENGTMNLDQAVNIEDLHRMAKRRLPKIAFDFIEGGLEDERGSSATPATPR